MASVWDITSSSVVLLIFLGAVYGITRLSRTLTTSSQTTRQSLGAKGVSYENGRVSIKTDRAAPSREEYIASTQRAFEKGAKTMSLHPEAFRTGPSKSASPEPPTVSAVESTDKKGFRRTKKLA
ncbi:hypothetical protein BCR39DRAFT_511734 [Naematelia encephala]|uniref:Uncharacterized protein n=1 Tax=Naematelia encephala TaxID=71784 RepID=A0A1Y2BM24_9TREE|nr:hypothetical protein BCR39DRAFT_511734 [Naematelia encephala]